MSNKQDKPNYWGEKGKRQRNFLLTVNNPLEHNLSQEKLISLAEKTGKLDYWCISDEIGGEEKTPHTHMYLYFSNPIQQTTIGRTFQGCHIDNPLGNSMECRNYVLKEGPKYDGTEKQKTRVEGTQKEYGNLPKDGGYTADSESKLVKATKAIQEGRSVEEILLELGAVQKSTRDAIMDYAQRWKASHMSDIKPQTVYLHFGECRELAKDMIKRNGTNDIYLVRDYRNPFDGYKGESILILDRYKGQLNFGDFLSVIDNLKVGIRARYENKVSLWTEVHVVCSSEWYVGNILSRMLKQSEEEFTTEELKEVLEKVDYLEYHFIKNKKPCSYILNSMAYIDDKVVMQDIEGIMLLDEDYYNKNWPYWEDPDWEEPDLTEQQENVTNP